MSTFSVNRTIKANTNEVWQALADIGNIYEWNPGVVHSEVTSDQATGLGAERHCDLGGKNYLDEEVVDWEVDQRLTMRIVGTNLPFKTADIRFTLRPENDATTITVSPEYKLKFGIIGSLLDALFVHRTYKKGMGDLLDGLKEHVERQSMS